jgi:hypothetical protein
LENAVGVIQIMTPSSSTGIFMLAKTSNILKNKKFLKPDLDGHESVPVVT